MARYETKSIQVSPDSEQHTINIWQKFGWTLESSQEIFNQDSHLENRGGDLYNVTKTTNYVKLVFKRNKDMAYYNEVCKLENQYHNIVAKEPKLEKFGCLIKIAIAILILGIAYFNMVRSDREYLPLAIIATVIATALGGIYIFLRIKSSASYKKSHEEWESQCIAILAKVKKYV